MFSISVNRIVKRFIGSLVFQGKIKYNIINYLLINTLTEKALKMTGIDPKTLMKMLGFEETEIISVTLDDKNELNIKISNTKQGTNCHCCDSHIETYYCAGNMVKLRHLPVFGLVTYILIEPARYVCNHCKNKPTTTQASSWYQQGLSYTKKYTEHILLSLINSTIKDVCIKENIGYDVIEGMIERNINHHVDWSEIETLGIIGIDEISIKKGHQDFVVIVTGIIDDNLCILAVLKDRKKATVKKFSLHSKSFKKTG